MPVIPRHDWTMVWSARLLWLMAAVFIVGPLTDGFGLGKPPVVLSGPLLDDQPVPVPRWVASAGCLFFGCLLAFVARSLGQSTGRSVALWANSNGIVAEERFSRRPPRVHRFSWDSVEALLVDSEIEESILSIQGRRTGLWRRAGVCILGGCSQADCERLRDRLQRRRRVQTDS